MNWVIGVPGETDEDVEEGIEFILKNKRYIGRLANINPLILVNGGVYWLEPEKHNIVFRENKDELFAKFKRAIPAHLWYSTDPYIDELVRKRWFEEIIIALHEGGFEIGAWAARVIEDVQKARDLMRTGERAAAAAASEKTAFARRIDESADDRPIRMSDGVGPMSEPDTSASELEFNPDARSSAYVFRAGSVLPSDCVAQVDDRVALVRYDDELFAFEPVVLTNAFGSAVLDPEAATSTVFARDVLILSAVGKGAVAQLLRTIGTYNIVQFDGYFYGVPHSFGAIEWGVADLATATGVLISQNMRSLVRAVEKALGIDREADRQNRRRTEKPRPGLIQLSVAPAAASAVTAPPLLVGAVDAYNVLEYEGWFYGVPQALGNIDLATTDVVEMPGVIRDLSRDVVESEIRETHASAR